MEKLKKSFKLLFFLGVIFINITSCSFFDDGKKKDDVINITSLKLSNSKLSTQVAGICYLGFYTTPSYSIKPTWNYDSSIIEVEEQSSGIIIKGIKEGETAITCTYKNMSATAIITVSGFAETYIDTTEPYIYSDVTVIQMKPNDAETIHVSLYNGTAADIDGYTWSIENPAVATISSTGQYCTIKSLNQGYSRIKVTHTKAPYPYYIGVYVLEDINNVTFITTNNNIVKLNTSDEEKSISVDLKNPKSSNYTRNFSWEIIEGSDYLSILSNAEKCILTPIKDGNAIIRITHPDAEYPLDITVRVVEIVDNVYIEPSTTKLILNGINSNNNSITASLVGLEEGSEYSNDDFYFEVQQELDVFGVGKVVDYHSFSNQITFTGKHNGSALLYIGHPKAAKKRQVLIITEEQIADAVDASCLITTSQNYIKTKVGAEETKLSVLLKGGSEEDNLNFKWTVSQQPKETGSSQNVIELITTDGVVSSRAATQTFTQGIAYIKPLSVGTATITVTNSKSYYPLEILVNVLDETAILEEQYYFTGDGIVKFLNNETYNYQVSLKSAPESIKNKISWKSDSETLIINANEEKAELSSSGKGSIVSHLTIEHPSAQSPKEVLVLNADTQEELDSIKAFYSNKTFYSLNVENTLNIYVNHVGFDTEETEFDFDSVASQIVWSSSDPNIASVERGENPLNGIITGNKSGTAKITIKYGEVFSEFTVTVYPKDVIIGEIEKSIYFSTTQNVLILNKNEIKTASISAIGLDPKEYSKISWISKNEEIVNVVSNGITATINALQEGETEIHISHPDSENTLKLYVRVGSEYVSPSNSITHIAASTDVIAILKDTPNYTLTATLVNPKNQNDTLSDFTFSIEDSSIANIIAQYPSGTCYLKPISAGQTEITITHPKAKWEKKILVVIGNTLEELAEFKYLTTDTNVVNIGEGTSKTITVKLENATDLNSSVVGYNWSSSDNSIVSIKQTSSGTALLYGNKIGTAKLTITHEESEYPLEILVNVIDPIQAAATPYIQVPNPILNLIESSEWSTLTAELIGGKEEDSKDFIWTIFDGLEIIDLYYQNGIAKIKAKKDGAAVIRVTHPKAPYPQDVRIICDKAESKEYSISVSSGNIMSIRPDEGDQTITATLVNGSTTDKYNFKWSLDVYDIVDLTYSANTAIITPLKEGTVTLTISHPKSAYDQQIKIKVQQYDSFAFSTVSKTVAAGQSTFVTMQVPTSSIPTTVSYYSEDDSVARISGTNAVCQITGVEQGTVTVHAQLISDKTGIVQAEVDMLVIVTPAAENLTYITGTAGLASTFSMTQGTSKVLTAEIVGDGITIADQTNLIWSVQTDQNVITLANADASGKVSGNSAYISATSAGETTLTITHEKTSYSLVYHIIVPGAEETDVTLDKHYVSIEKGKTTEIKATVSSGKSADYKALEWSISRVNGDEIATVNGTGQTVTIYALKAGTVYLRCTFPGSGLYDECQITINDPKTLSLDRQVLRLPPGPQYTRSFSYKVTPTDATINWVYSSANDGSSFFTFSDSGTNSNGEGIVTITGLKEGTSQLSGVSSYGPKANIQIQVAWDYELHLNGSTIFTITPDETKSIEYSVTPYDSIIKVESIDCITNGGDIFTYEIQEKGDGIGNIVIKPLKESDKESSIVISAINPTNDEIVGKKEIKASFKYSDLDLHIKTEQLSSTGNFSRFDSDSNTLFLSDGETSRIKLSILEEKSDAAITNVTFSGEGVNYSAAEDFSNNNKTNVYDFINTDEDFIEKEYVINKAYLPFYGEQQIPDWDTAFNWFVVWDKHSNSYDDYSFSMQYKNSNMYNKFFSIENYYVNDEDGNFSESKTEQNFGKDFYAFIWSTGLKWENYNNIAYPDFSYGENWTIKEAPSLVGKTYSESDFKKIAWFYCPGTRSSYGKTVMNSKQGVYELSIDYDGPTDFLDAEGTDRHLYIQDFIMTKNVDATLRDSTDTRVKERKYVGKISITITHNGKPVTKEISVYKEKYNCNKNYSK